jgi:hypothetical protein
VTTYKIRNLRRKISGWSSKLPRIRTKVKREGNREKRTEENRKRGAGKGRELTPRRLLSQIARLHGLL